MAHDPLSPARKKADEYLYDERPDRYDVRNAGEDTETDAEWLDLIADKVADEIDATDAVRHLARNIVRQREGRATRSANKVLREFAVNGQLPLGWWEMERQPVAIITRTQRPGRDPEVREERVALGAVTPEDLRAFANEERVRAGRDFSARNATCDGAELMADQMVKGQYTHFQQWAEVVGPQEGDDLGRAS